MSARGFGSVIWVGTVAGAALGFYLVSLRVASERAALEEVETQIALTQRDIRVLQTEIGTRGRLAQLERWNVKFIRLSAPSADQFVDSGFHLATLAAPAPKPTIEAPVVMASAPVDPEAARPRLTSDGDGEQPTSRASRPIGEMVHVASYSVPEPPAATRPSLPKAAPEAARQPLPKARTTNAAPATKPVKTATADPLAPLQGVRAKAKGLATSAPADSRSTRSSRDTGSD